MFGSVTSFIAELLNADGGGVRGLSSIMILKHLMRRINDRRKDNNRLEPWQVFDMIAGTSTGGSVSFRSNKKQVDALTDFKSLAFLQSCSAASKYR